jgi:hypothetical protein
MVVYRTYRDKLNCWHRSTPLYESQQPSANPIQRLDREAAAR